MVGSYALGAIHLIIMIHINMMPILSDVNSNCLATGLNNVVGNKGAVGISFRIGSTRMLCLSSHLAAE